MALRKSDYNQALQESHENFITLIDEPDSSTTYVGVSKSSDTTASTWQIKKIAVSGTVTTITYADNDDSFVKIWANRTSYSY